MSAEKKPLLLVTEPESKRAAFFQKAAAQQKIPVTVLDWRRESVQRICELAEGRKVKIDPPTYPTAQFEQCQKEMDAYQDFLRGLSAVSAEFLNTPDCILQLLNKKECKLRLQQQNISVTRMVAADVTTVEELLQILQDRHLSSVFIKPIWYSGAAGVVALHMQPRTGKMTAYTSTIVKEGRLRNTKHLYYLTGQETITALLQAVLKLGVVVERWQPKSMFQGKCYDLRVVWQFGKAAFTVVRQSSGPITNLHLNNQAVSFSELALTKEQQEEIVRLCNRAAAAFPGLHMAGIDILLDKNTKKPYIIEMNGQGDLIYQDIFDENLIYREQVCRMWKKKEETTWRGNQSI